MNLSRYPTLKSFFSMCSSHSILSMMFFAVRSFSFLWWTGASLNCWEIWPFSTGHNSTIKSLNTLIDQMFGTFLNMVFQLTFPSKDEFIAIYPVFLLWINVKLFEHFKYLNPSGRVTLWGFETGLEGLRPSWDLSFLPHPWTRLFSSEWTLHYSSWTMSLCWTLTLIIPKTSSIYFLSIVSRVWPVTFYDLNILT